MPEQSLRNDIRRSNAAPVRICPHGSKRVFQHGFVCCFERRLAPNHRAHESRVRSPLTAALSDAEPPVESPRPEF
jgi:hypothetical protein